MAGLLDYLMATNPGLLGGSAFDPQMFAPPQQQAAQAAMPWANVPQMNQPSPFGGQQDASAIPQNAQPTMAMPRGMPTPPQSPGMLDRIMGGISSSPNTLMGMGAALMGGEGYGGAFKNAMAGQQIDRTNASMGATEDALIKSGVPAPIARAAALNPKLMETVAPEYFGGFKLVKTGSSPVGETYMMQGPGGKLYPLGGSSGPGAMAGSEGGGAPGVGNTGMLATGVKQYDPNLTGDEYLKQFAPEVQAAVKSYMNGDVMPTGNPRQQGIGTLAKTVATKYGQDMGIPVSDSIYNSKRKMQTDLGGSSPNSIGGILSNGKSAFAHLSELSDKAVGLGNYSLNGVPFGGLAANAINKVGAMAGDSTTRGNLKGFSDNALKYGQEATKFYAGTGGGEAERMNTLNTLNPETASGPELAAYLETEKSLMMDRLRQKESQVRDVMGDGYLQQHPVITPDLQQTLSKIDANIGKLRGTAPAAAPAPAAGGSSWKYLGAR